MSSSRHRHHDAVCACGKPPAGALPPREPPSFDGAGDSSSAVIDIEDVMGPMRTMEAILRMAERVRELWIVAYRNYVTSQTQKPCPYNSSVQWDGGKDKNGRIYKPVWPALALHICRNRLDPYALVNAQFETRMGKPPSPTIMQSEYGMAAYRLYHANIAAELEQALASQKLALRVACFMASASYADPKMALRSVLYDKNVGATALFRFCVATSEGLLSVAHFWRQLALEQYLCEPGCHDAVWRELIPEDLKKEARALARAFELVELGKGAARENARELLEELWADKDRDEGASYQ